MKPIKARNMLSLFLALSLMLATMGCAPGGDSGSVEPDFADDEVVRVLAHSLEKRFELADEQEEAVTPIDADYYADCVEVELDSMKPFKDRLFEDSELQEMTISYINLLEDAIDLTEMYPVDSLEFLNEWQNIYDERTSLLKQFVNDYGLQVKTEYEDTLDALLINANAVEERAGIEESLNKLIDSIAFEKQVDEFGFVTYVATAENTSGIDLEHVSLLLALYDEEGVRVEEAHANTSSWPSGETVRFEAFSDVDAAEIKVSLDYYGIADE